MADVKLKNINLIDTQTNALTWYFYLNNYHNGARNFFRFTKSLRTKNLTTIVF